MASIRKDIDLEAPADDVWDALRDFGALHTRLVPGFVVDTQLDGDRARVVTFFSGMVARELLVGIDDETRRLAYTVVEGPLQAQHYGASAQVLPTDAGRTRLVWRIDVLPDHLAPMLSELMDRGAAAMQHALSRA